MADPTQIYQIIMNLCTNSFHAIKSKGISGVLDISLTRTHIDEDSILLTMDMKPGDYLCLSVSDTGVGIPSDIRERIFDPYFTTKGQKEGNGLGLAVVHGIVKKHKGNIVVNSKVGEGTTFYVYLPVKE